MKYSDEEIYYLCKKYLLSLGVGLSPLTPPRDLVNIAVSVWKERKEQGLEIMLQENKNA